MIKTPSPHLNESLPDTSLRTSTDSLAHYLHRRQTLSSAYARIEALVADSNFAEAESCLELLPEQYPMNEAETEAFAHYNTWFGFQKSLAQNGRSLMQLNEQEIDALLDLAYAYDRSGAQIRNLLCFLYDICIELEIQGGEPEMKTIARNKDYTSDKEHSVLEVFPNPANTYLTFRVLETSTEGPLVLSIFDVQGRRMYTSGLKKAPVDHLIDTRSFKEGSYLYHLQDATGIIESGKVLIRH